MPKLTNLRKVAVSLAMFAIVALGSTIAARADTVFILSGADFSGTTNNTGGNITVNISNIAGGVRISITNNLIDPGAFLGSLYLNTSVAPLANASAACVSCLAIGVAGTPTYNGTPGWSFGSNAFQPSGDRYYDLFLSLPTDAGGGLRLTPGETIVFDVTSTTAGFNAASFLSLSSGTAAPFQTAAHIQGLPASNSQSDWITNVPVPEPATMLLLGTGLIAVAVSLRRHVRK